MKPQEFRIGNLIYSKELDVNNSCEILLPKEVGYYDLYELLRGDTFKKYSPIPLTEEWLLKFGFETDMIETNTYYFLDFNNIERILWHNNSCIYGILGVSQYEWSNIKINYVHQLQNLYFALTCEELQLI